MFQTSSGNKGFIFLEILIAVGLISVVFVMLLSIGVQSLTLSRSLEKVAEINSLTREEMEAVRAFRDGTVWATTGLGTVATGDTNPYYLVQDTSVNPPKWILQTGIESIGDMTRKVVFDKVSRGSGGGGGGGGQESKAQVIENAYNPDYDDPQTIKVTVTVSYEGRDYQVVTYLTNWQNN